MNSLKGKQLEVKEGLHEEEEDGRIEMENDRNCKKLNRRTEEETGGEKRNGEMKRRSQESDELSG